MSNVYVIHEHLVSHLGCVDKDVHFVVVVGQTQPSRE